MLGKKSLAIALMGLGLVGSAYADEYAMKQEFTVNFKATVKAAACKFSVESTGAKTITNGIEVSLGDSLKRTSDNFKGAYVPLNFVLSDCAGVAFNTVNVVSDPNSGIIELSNLDDSNGKANAVIYDVEDGQKYDGGAFTYAMSEVNDEGKAVKQKWVRFEATDKTSLGRYEGTVVYTATYQ